MIPRCITRGTSSLIYDTDNAQVNHPPMTHNPTLPYMNYDQGKMLLIGLTGSIATGKSTVSRVLSGPPYNIPIIDTDVLAREAVEPGTRAYHQIVKYFGDTTPDLFRDLSPTSHSQDGERKILAEDDDQQWNQADLHLQLRENQAQNTTTTTTKKKKEEEKKTISLPALNRAALGRRIFGDDAPRRRDRAVLNSIVHPPVRRAMYFSILRAYIRGHWAVVLDVPLLFESGLDLFCGLVIVVGVHDVEIQIARLQARDGSSSRKDAIRRVQSQVDVRTKAKRAQLRNQAWPGSGMVIWNDHSKEDLQRELETLIKDVQRGTPLWWARFLWLFPPLAVMVGLWNVWKSWRAKRSWGRQHDDQKTKAL